MSTAVITMSQLGQMGQWGNQIFQYAFVRTCARRYGWHWQLPPWVGQYLFGYDDPPVTVSLPEKRERHKPSPYEACFGEPIMPEDGEYANYDFRGYAQYHTSWYEPDREFVRSLFTCLTGVEYDRLLLPSAELCRSGGMIIGLHIRRADAGRMIYHLSPVAWYLEWLDKNWGRFRRPTLFIATEDLSLVPEFRKYHPVLVENLGVTLRAEPMPLDSIPAKAADLNPPKPRRLDYFPDWWMLAHCDVIVASDSTFSFTAAMMGSCREFWQSRISRRGFVRIDPWDSDVSPREHLDDYPGVPGTSLDDNEYWVPYERPKKQEGAA